MKRSMMLIVALSLAVFGVTAGAGPASAGSNDQAIADAGIIEAGDMPATWSSSPQDRSSVKKNLAVAKRTKGCTQYVKFAVANEATTKAESDDYELDGQQLSNLSYVHKSEAVATKLMESLQDPSVVGCLQAVLEKGIKTEILKDKDARRQIDDVTLELGETTLDEIADDQVAYEGTLTITLKDGSEQEIDVALVALRAYRVILTYSISAPPDATDIPDVFATALTNTLVRTYNSL